jgi:hypothetical protein
MGRNLADFNGYKLTFSDGTRTQGYHSVGVEHPTIEGLHEIRFNWHTAASKTPGKIEDLWLPEEHRGKGLATAMFRFAQKEHMLGNADTAPTHSADRTDAGDAWAKKVGGKLPKRNPNMIGW